MSLLSRVRTLFSGSHDGRRLEQRRAFARRFSAIQAANSGAGARWSGTSDDFNQEYVTALDGVLKRAQDLDVNNPDIHGFHRTRTAQCIGKGVQMKAAFRADEVGLSAPEAAETAERINRVRELHSLSGGFDSTGRGFSEEKQQERAFLTMLVNGRCLVHRVWLSDPNRLLPLSLELIPGWRISTPFDRYADPRISFGFEYTDEHRTRLVGFHVRRVSKTIGNSFIPDFVWDFVPAVDAALMSLTEMAGLDQAMPACHSLVRMLRNRGEFIESAVECARAQSQFYGVTECAQGANPWVRAEEDRGDSGTDQMPAGFIPMGASVQMLYAMFGEKVSWNSAKLPEPDFSSFMDKTDARCARGLVASKSRFTREITSSWAGGRLEDQQDDPVVDELRENFLIAWRQVHAWVIEACWLSGAVELPGYSSETKIFWNEARAQFPGKIHINPVDTAAARRQGYALRTLTPQQACEEDGKDLRTNLREWARAVQMVREEEKLHGLREGTLDYLLEDPALTAQASSEKDSACANKDNALADATPDATPDVPEKQESGRQFNRLLRYFAAKVGAK